MNQLECPTVTKGLIKVVEPSPCRRELPTEKVWVSKDGPKYRKTVIDKFNIREVKAQTWLTRGKDGKVKEYKIETHFIIEYNGHYLSKFETMVN